MSEFFNTHYNLIDTLIFLDRENWLLACECVHELQLKENMAIDIKLAHGDTDVLVVASMIRDRWEKKGFHHKIEGAFSTTLAEAAIWACLKGYRHESGG